MSENPYLDFARHGEPTFMDRCLLGLVVEPADMAREIDDEIDHWHDSETMVIPLHEWLGMTPEEYARWVSRPSELAAIVEERRDKAAEVSP